MFSENRAILNNLIFNDQANLSEMIQTRYNCSHTITRTMATLSLTDLIFTQVYISEGATHYRIQKHLSIISDYIYSEASHRYEPVSSLNAKSAFVYSAYTPIHVALSIDMIALFPVGIFLNENCSVMQCIGVEFFIKSFGNVYLPFKGGAVKVAEVF